ncbi:hypothetical protein BY458DRAFT_494349 [Sporodiniella umbellata]|nr:hypothetical protein BY458DRAFT_494349 [Sporodiniella umbellata]
MLAWLQKQLEIYVRLSLIPPVEELNSISENKTMTCLAHRCFPESVDLIPRVIQANEQPVYTLFQAVGIDLDQPQWLTLVQQQFSNYPDSDPWIETSERLLSSYLSAYEQQKEVCFAEEHSFDSVPDCLRLHPNRSALEAVRCAVEYQVQVRNQLDFVQAKILNIPHTGLESLEQRMRFEWIPMGLREKHGRIGAWLREVKVWFSEAERIRQWIEQRIVLLEAPIEGDLQQLNEQQEMLESEVDQFDLQDMARLRAHVKALTGSSKDLSPADTTTIEITFSTLMLLDRLMYLLRTRAYELHLMTLKSDWQRALATSMDWIEQTSDRLTQWTEKAVCEPNRLRNQLMEDLVVFETQCAAFDQAQWALTVELYQSMNDASHEALSDDVATQQTRLEHGYNSLTRQVAQTRRWAEQYVVIADFLAQAEQLKTQGIQLNDTPEPDAAWAEKITLFEQALMRLVTRIPSSISVALCQYQTELEQLRDRLQTRLRMYHRAGDIQRLSSWADERMRALTKHSMGALDAADLRRLRKERDAQLIKLEGIRTNDYVKLQAHRHPTLEPSLQHLGRQLDALQQALEVHTERLDTLEKRIEWETSYTQSMQRICQTTGDTWHCIQRAQWRPQASDAWDPKLGQTIQTDIDQAVEVHDRNRTVYGTLMAQQGLDDSEHIQRRQETLDRHLSQLKHLSTYVQAVIEQRRTLELWMTEADQLYRQGQGLLALSSEAFQSEATEPFCAQVEALWPRLMTRLCYPQCQAQARATRPSTTDDAIHAQIEQSVNATYAALQALVAEVRKRKQREPWLKAASDLIERMYHLQHQITTPLPSPPLALEAMEADVDQLRREACGLISQSETWISVQDVVERLSKARKDLIDGLEGYRHESKVERARLAWEAAKAGSDWDVLREAFESLRSLMGERLPPAIQQAQEAADESHRQWQALTQTLEAIEIPRLTEGICLERTVQDMAKVEQLGQKLKDFPQGQGHVVRQLGIKQEGLRQALEVATFLKVAGGLERMQEALEEAVGKSGILMNRLSRSELKSKLDQLDVGFQAYESKRESEARVESQDPEVRAVTKDCWEKIELRWQELKRQYKARKRALTVQDRSRKSSLPTPVAKTTAVYVADPKNDLDMEIGRIVNNAPYKVKVKMVPGEVGRYWFGDQNPKLAYCRVLKSKMVMVRVGGGWSELSKFLRDHALLEVERVPMRAHSGGIHEALIETRKAIPQRLPTPSHSHHLSPKPKQASASQKPVPSHSQRPTPNPSHRLSSRLPTLSQSLWANTPSQSMGYKQGDLFITVDDYGNPLEVKMRRFSKEVHS